MSGGRLPLYELTRARVHRVPARAGGRVLGVRVPGADGPGPGRGLPLRAHAGVAGGRAAAARRLRIGARRLCRRAGPARAASWPAAEAETALRNGKVSLLVVPGEPPAYRFDPTRPESRLARLVADAALQRAAGRADACSAARGDGGHARLALHRLAAARPAGHEHHGHRDVERRLLGGGGARRASCSSG